MEGDCVVSVVPNFPSTTWDELVGAWQELDVPEGWRAEIIKERIVVTPPSGYSHNLIVSRLHKALVRVVPDDWEIFQAVGVYISAHGGLFIPDLLVIPRNRVPADDATPMLAEKALLAIEITSKHTADTDRTTKLWSYALGNVPLYVLIDRFAENGPSVTLYSEPDDGVYQEAHKVPFGKAITLPEPFSVLLNTRQF